MEIERRASLLAMPRSACVSATCLDAWCEKWDVLLREGRGDDRRGEVCSYEGHGYTEVAYGGLGVGAQQQYDSAVIQIDTQRQDVSTANR